MINRIIIEVLILIVFYDFSFIHFLKKLERLVGQYGVIITSKVVKNASGVGRCIAFCR